MRLKTLHNNQNGIVAFVVTMLVMSVVVVTAVGLSTIAHREQRQAVDRLISTEAYYAAESGVNDAVQRIQYNQTHTITDPNQQISSFNDCSNGTNLNVVLDYLRQPPYNITSDLNQMSLSSSPAIVGAVANVVGDVTTESGYSCALIDPSPTDIRYPDVSPGQAATTNLNTPANIDRLVIGWESYQQTNNTFKTINCNKFEKVGSWLFAPMLKVDITNLPNPASFNRTSLINNTQTYYLSPCQGSGLVSQSFTTGAANSGQILNGNCASSVTASLRKPLSCNVNFINFSPATKNVLLRITSLYGEASVKVLALNSGSAQHISGAQTVIDVTGKSADEVRRIQARINPQGKTEPYVYAVESVNSVCKRLQTAPAPQTTSAVAIPGLTGDPEAFNPGGSCQP